MILDPCAWVSEDFLLAIGGFPQEYHLRPSPGVLISSLEGAWVVLDGIKFSDTPCFSPSSPWPVHGLRSQFSLPRKSCWRGCHTSVRGSASGVTRYGS